MAETSRIDLDAYLGRIGIDRAPSNSLEALEALHLAHLAAIPFENVDVRLGRPIRLDLGSIQAKLVAGRRGGYCFEQNTLFAAVLRDLGFEVQTLEARVRPPGATRQLPRTHMVLRVELGGRGWLADVGFGGDGPLLPVPLDGETSEQPDAAYRVEHEPGGIHVLQRRAPTGWADLYAFGLEPALPVDFEVANHFTATHPQSIFVQTLTVQRSTAEKRHILRGRLYTCRSAGQEAGREVSPGELRELLAEQFGLQLPEPDVIAALG